MIKPSRKETRDIRRMTRLTKSEDRKLVRLSNKAKVTPSSYLQFLVQTAQ